MLGSSKTGSQSSSESSGADLDAVHEIHFGESNEEEELGEDDEGGEMFLDELELDSKNEQTEMGLGRNAGNEEQIKGGNIKKQQDRKIKRRKSPGKPKGPSKVNKTEPVVYGSFLEDLERYERNTAELSYETNEFDIYYPVFSSSDEKPLEMKQGNSETIQKAKGNLGKLGSDVVSTKNQKAQVDDEDNEKLLSFELD